jgi:sRNA-binding regulator protein Hfq
MLKKIMALGLITMTIYSADMEESTLGYNVVSSSLNSEIVAPEAEKPISLFQEFLTTNKNNKNRVVIYGHFGSYYGVIKSFDNNFIVLNHLKEFGVEKNGEAIVFICHISAIENK